MPAAHVAMASQVLAHVPELVFVGSKPRRELERSPDLAASLGQSLRNFDHAARYLPNQVFIGARSPRPLTAPERPWWQSPADEPRSETQSGALFTQGEFFAALSKIDTTGLVEVENNCSGFDGTAARGAVVGSLAEQPHQTQLLNPVAIRGVNGDVLAKIGWGFADDEALSPFVALENLATKATAALALAHLLRANSIDPGSIDYVISCSEEAVGDRYQRGGGNMGKAVAESVGATRASGFDVKNFCAAPISAMLVASSLVEAGVADRVAVVAGGSLPKLGMKFQGHLQNGMPILEDCLGGVALLVGRDLDGPVIRYDAVGRHQVQAGSASAQILSNLVFDPLDRAGLKATDCGLFGTELHNPELTEPQGSGDVPMRNYRTIAALAVQLRHIDDVDIGSFLETRCVAGFAPTQGHIASAVCLLPNILDRMRAGSLRRAQLVAKGSLFLGRMTAMSDGMSLVLEN